MTLSGWPPASEGVIHGTCLVRLCRAEEQGEGVDPFTRSCSVDLGVQRHTYMCAF